MSIRSQSMLGGIAQETKNDTAMSGTLLFGIVTKVYQKNHSADVQISNNQYGTLSTADNNEGKYSCRILENYAGFDSDLNIAYGTVTPIQVGSCVIVGFVNNCKAQPVILGCLHSTENSKNILPSEYPLNEGDEVDRMSTITRLGDYFTVNSDGEWEIGHHSGAFIHSSSNEIDDENFEWNNLQFGNSIQYSETAKPLSILGHILTFLGKIRLFIDGINGAIRLYRTVEEESQIPSVSLIEFTKDGDFRIKIQNDSNKIDDTNSKSYTEVKIAKETGNVNIEQVFDSKSNKIVISKDGVSVNSDVSISINSKESLNITSDKSIFIDAPVVNIPGIEDD